MAKSRTRGGIRVLIPNIQFAMIPTTRLHVNPQLHKLAVSLDRRPRFSPSPEQAPNRSGGEFADVGAGRVSRGDPVQKRSPVLPRHPASLARGVTPRTRGRVTTRLAGATRRFARTAVQAPGMPDSETSTARVPGPPPDLLLPSHRRFRPPGDQPPASHRTCSQSMMPSATQGASASVV